MHEKKLIKMHATSVMNSNGRMDLLYRGGLYEVPSREAEDFVKNGLAYYAQGNPVSDKSMGRPGKVKEDAIIEVSNPTRRKRGRPRGSKNIPKN